MRNVTLYYREGASDKVYQAGIQPKDGKFVVNFAYGRRGAALNSGTKTPAPVDEATASKIFERLVGEKKAKGYTEGADGTPYQHTEQEGKISGYLPQLLNPVGEEEVESLLADPDWCMQEKFDGRRMMLHKQGAAIHGINRRGLLTGLSSPVLAQVRELGHDLVIDGEWVGEAFHAFDLVSLDCQHFGELPYESRIDQLNLLLEPLSGTSIQPVITCTTEKEKRDCLAALKKLQKEGVVFKRLDAPYTPGRPASGGTQLKHKFHATASFIVAGTNKDKRSVRLALFENLVQREAGNVTIPPNHPIPALGDVVEVRFLYAFRESGAVYQPVYLGKRDDVGMRDCVTSQLKYRASLDQDPDEN